MKASATKGKASQLGRSHLAHRASGPSRGYLQTRVRASRLFEVAFILAIAELTRRLHQAYAQAYDQQAADSVLPQNPSQIPLGNLHGNVADLLKGDCAKFATSLIDAAAVASKGSKPAHSSDALKLFNEISSRPGGLVFETTRRKGEIVAGGISGSIGHHDATIYISPQSKFGRPPTREDISLLQYVYAITAIHETIHLSGLYTDTELAGAAYALTKTPGFETTDPSTYWDNILQSKCPRSKP